MNTTFQGRPASMVAASSPMNKMMTVPRSGWRNMRRMGTAMATTRATMKCLNSRRPLRYLVTRQHTANTVVIFANSAGWSATPPMTMERSAPRTWVPKPICVATSSNVVTTHRPAKRNVCDQNA